MSNLLLVAMVHIREAKDCTDQVGYVILLYLKTGCVTITDKELKYFSKLLRAISQIQILIYNFLFVSIAINSIWKAMLFFYCDQIPRTNRKLFHLYNFLQTSTISFS